MVFNYAKFLGRPAEPDALSMDKLAVQPEGAPKLRPVTTFDYLSVESARRTTKKKSNETRSDFSRSSHKSLEFDIDTDSSSKQTTGTAEVYATELFKRPKKSLPSKNSMP